MISSAIFSFKNSSLETNDSWLSVLLPFLTKVPFQLLRPFSSLSVSFELYHRLLYIHYIFPANLTNSCQKSFTKFGFGSGDVRQTELFYSDLQQIYLKITSETGPKKNVKGCNSLWISITSCSALASSVSVAIDFFLLGLDHHQILNWFLLRVPLMSLYSSVSSQKFIFEILFPAP